VRSTLLRAHPLLDGGVISGGAFGRRLVSGGVEWRRWSRPGTWLVQFAPAAFVDVARATRGFGASDTRTQVDAGIGVRLTAGGAGVLRVDLAHGLRDGRTALSIVLER
jgi:outer membrane translocation and assembly module TamA